MVRTTVARRPGPGRPSGSSDKPFDEPEMAPEMAPADDRPEMRPEMRADDPRARAAARAAAVLDNLQDEDQGTDEFFIDKRVIPDGWTYEWKRQTVMGQEDPAYAVDLARKGWEPVPADRHPEYMPGGYRGSITRKGMVLMERPLSLSDRSRAIENRRARSQVEQKEQQLGSATFGENPSSERALKIQKSYEPIIIPDA